MNIKMKDADPEYINDFSRALLDGFYLREGETFNDALARAAEAYCFGDYELAQRVYDAAWNGWFMFASPILSNAPKGFWPFDAWTREGWEGTLSNAFAGEEQRSLPISCFGLTMPDTINGQMDTMKEVASLSVSGGGVGLYNEIRATTDKAPGPIPFEKVLDGLIGYYRQGKTRRGACVVYMDVNHPDILEHIKFREPTGGDRKRKSDNITQFHNAVNITDEFVDAVKNNDDFDLVCPHTGEVRETVKARWLWEEILDTRSTTGEPYLGMVDTANRALPQAQKDLGLKLNSSQLCVVPETKILTKEYGHVPIVDVVGEQVHVWNGLEWSKVIPAQTGQDQRIIKVQLSANISIECTPEHVFYTSPSKNKLVKVRAEDLEPGDKIAKFDAPVIETTSEHESNPDYWYWSGFYSGDGCDAKAGENRMYFYDEKMKLIPLFESQVDDIGRKTDQSSSSQPRIYFDFPAQFTKYEVPGVNNTIEERLAFLAGLADSDGTVTRNKSGKNWLEIIQIGNTNLEMLMETRLMLQTLGVQSKVTMSRPEGWYMAPDGRGGEKPYWCQNAYRLHISSWSLFTLSKLGWKTNRLKWDEYKPGRNCEHFIIVEDVLDEGRTSDTYCFTEPKRHMGVFNGILTGQCNEIWLPNNDERTFVCCLSSLNMEKYDEWKDTGLVADLVTYLDNVIQWFIEKAPDDLQKARFSASRERALGLGTMGWHYYLQSKSIPFEGGGFGSGIQHTHMAYKNIQEQAITQSLKLGEERGEAPDMVGTGRRNSHLMAIAPNSNNAIILGTSPCIEPVAGNAYMHTTRAGTFMVKNPHFEKVLEAYADGMTGDDEFDREAWIDAQWKSIITSEGSIQQLDFLSEVEKELFKTAYEIDQHWVVEQADARQQYICQGQSLNLFFPEGVSKAYFNSVHLKAIQSEFVKGLYYARTKTGISSSIVRDIEVKTLTDWVGDDDGSCRACEG